MVGLDDREAEGAAVGPAGRPAGGGKRGEKGWTKESSAVWLMFQLHALNKCVREHIWRI